MKSVFKIFLPAVTGLLLMVDVTIAAEPRQVPESRNQIVSDGQ